MLKNNESSIFQSDMMNTKIYAVTMLPCEYLPTIFWDDEIERSIRGNFMMDGTSQFGSK